MVAMSEYDETLAEDPKVNRMHESLKLFHSLCNIKWFLALPFLLFLNKKDVFEEKLTYSPLTKCFPDYKDGTSNGSPATYIWKQFEKENRARRQVYVHYTCAKDTKNINIVFDVMVDTIIVSNMKEAFLYE